MRILVVSSYGYWGRFSPEDVFTKTEKNIQVGGGETAMLHVSKALASLGHEVILFYPVERYGKFYGIDFVSPDLYLQMATQMKSDAIIAWDAPHALRYADQATVHVLAFQLNDAAIGPIAHMTDLYMHPSQWHADRYRSIYPEIDEKKQRATITNGLDYGRYNNEEVVKIPKRVIYSSSPDRGLHHLLRIWPEVKSREPEAELHVYYEIKQWMETTLKYPATEDMYKRALAVQEAIKGGVKGVTFHGGIGQYRLAIEQRKAAVAVYPCDPIRPTEGFCMTILEALAAGCHVLTTNVDALPELWSKAPNVTMKDLPVNDEEWTNALCDRICAPLAQSQYNANFAWATIGRRWVQELLTCLKSKSAT